MPVRSGKWLLVTSGYSVQPALCAALRHSERRHLTGRGSAQPHRRMAQLSARSGFFVPALRRQRGGGLELADAGQSERALAVLVTAVAAARRANGQSGTRILFRGLAQPAPAAGCESRRAAPTRGRARARFALKARAKESAFTYCCGVENSNHGVQTRTVWTITGVAMMSRMNPALVATMIAVLGVGCQGDDEGSAPNPAGTAGGGSQGSGAVSGSTTSGAGTTSSQGGSGNPRTWRGAQRRLAVARLARCLRPVPARRRKCGIVEIDVGVTVLNNESETELLPLVLAAIPSGGSRLAWMGDDDAVHVAGAGLRRPARDASFRAAGARFSGHRRGRRRRSGRAHPRRAGRWHAQLAASRATCATADRRRRSRASTCSWCATTARVASSGPRF